MSKQITVKASKFINWFYHDEEDTKHIGEEIEFLLKDQGYAEISIESIYNRYDELPDHILENVPQERQDEYIPTDEIEFVDDFAKEDCYKCHRPNEIENSFCFNCGTSLR